MTKANRILVKQGLNISRFMWANTSNDGSAVIGFSWEGPEELLEVFDSEKTEVKDLIQQPQSGQSKISFHESGHYKFSSKVGKSTETMDRITVVGPKISEISKPRLMAELLLPASMPLAVCTQRKKDILIDLTNVPSAPNRCSIICTSVSETNPPDKHFLSSSEWEVSYSLETDNHIWSWVFRRSSQDNSHPDKVLVFLPGDPSWGQIYVSVN